MHKIYLCTYLCISSIKIKKKKKKKRATGKGCNTSETILKIAEGQAREGSPFNNVSLLLGYLNLVVEALCFYLLTWKTEYCLPCGCSDS